MTENAAQETYAALVVVRRETVATARTVKVAVSVPTTSVQLALLTANVLTANDVAEEYAVPESAASALSALRVAEARA